ncbi:MAG: ABC transporter permease [Alphaproteobacteria bacterium]
MVKIVDKRWNDRELLAAAAPSSIIQIAFLMAPLLMLLVLTFQVMEFFQLVWVWDLTTWKEVFNTPYYFGILLDTLMMAALCVVLCLIIGFPVAYGLGTRFRAFENHIKVLIIFAFLTDAVLKTYGWVIVLDQNGVINWALKGLHLVGPEFDHGIVFTPYATMIGMVYNLIPFMIFTIYLSVINIDRDLIQASYDCGASKFRTFWEVTLPLCRPGIWAGTLLVFVLGLGAFLEERAIGGGKEPLMGSLIHNTFGTRVNWPLGSAITVILMIVAIVIIFAFVRTYRLDKYAAR